MPVAQAARIVSAAVVSSVAVVALTVSPSSAVTEIPCTATVMAVPHPYSIVTIIVATRPHAAVTATERSGPHSWPMTPDSTANAFGRARLSQKMSAVRHDAIVRVSVDVTLNGATGHCSTFYTPPSLVPLTES